MTHLLRRVKEIADAAKVPNTTLPKFRHTYATRLLESCCDLVTVQNLMGHSDIETTRQYLGPDEALRPSTASPSTGNGRKTILNQATLRKADFSGRTRRSYSK